MGSTEDEKVDATITSARMKTHAASKTTQKFWSTHALSAEQIAKNSVYKPILANAVSSEPSTMASELLYSPMPVKKPAVPPKES